MYTAYLVYIYIYIVALLAVRQEPLIFLNIFTGSHFQMCCLYEVGHRQAVTGSIHGLILIC